MHARSKTKLPLKRSREKDEMGANVRERNIRCACVQGSPDDDKEEKGEKWSPDVYSKEMYELIVHGTYRKAARRRSSHVSGKERKNKNSPQHPCSCLDKI